MKRLIITAIILFGIVAVCQASMTMRMGMRMGGGALFPIVGAAVDKNGVYAVDKNGIYAVEAL